MAMKTIDAEEYGIEDDICNQLLDRADLDRTPDFLERKLDHFIPVLVYGTLRIGGYFHDTLDGLPFLGDAMTQQAAFTMQETAGYPVAYHICSPQDQRMNHRGKIFGEVFVVDPKTLLRLDEIEDNGRMYTRKQFYVKLLNQGTGSHNLIKAWMYVGVDNYWLDEGTQKMVQDVKSKDSSAGPVYEWSRSADDTKDTMWEDYVENAYGYQPQMNDRIPF